ncbi:MAG TPA: GntR family transcriptional regulator [Tepidanaerobacter syntrophicus]|uniref:GntR family transcriptional regulator n=1 Tax=Tepidanaerobacter syntrophicus TaxID=224999 RepID=UPI00175199AE|nr:GntR family transcriptional regulator [Tepidanaerobacter syntrophicus]HHV83496.1 GntR family transcriptional regulator [Tepidanaerobacter syntrophicus]
MGANQISININELTPKYLQIIQYFAEKIENGDLKEGDKLPTEQEICNFFNVSRITARQALDELTNKGYIVKKQGKGSYVSINKMKMQLNSLQGFSEEMRSKGLEPSSKLLSLEICNPSLEVATKLNIDPSVKVYSIERIRYANNVALSLENVFIPFFLCPDIEQYDLTDSLYKILQKNYNIVIKRANQSIEAGFVDKRAAKLLNVKAGTQALIIERVTYTSNDTPLEYVKSLYRGDKYKFYVDLYK